jgi:hypothetical protein
LSFSLNAQHASSDQHWDGESQSNYKARCGCRELEPDRCCCNGLRVDFASINRKAPIAL